MRNFKKVNLDGKGGDIAGNRGPHSGDHAEPSKYYRPESRYASEESETSEWAWKGDDPREKPTTGMKPIPAKAWKGSEKLTKPITGVKPVPANRWKGAEQNYFAIYQTFFRISNDFSKLGASTIVPSSLNLINCTQ